jgi:hypothetical protein
LYVIPLDLERGLVVGGLIVGGFGFFFALSKLGEKRLKMTESQNHIPVLDLDEEPQVEI